jgi:hypothetical protein
MLLYHIKPDERLAFESGEKEIKVLVVSTCR